MRDTKAYTRLAQIGRRSCFANNVVTSLARLTQPAVGRTHGPVSHIIVVHQSPDFPRETRPSRVRANGRQTIERLAEVVSERDLYLGHQAREIMFIVQLGMWEHTGVVPEVRVDRTLRDRVEALHLAICLTKLAIESG